MYILLCTCIYLVHNLTYLFFQSNDKNLAGCVRLDVNFLKPSIVEFMQEQAPVVNLGEGQVPYQNWLEYVYRTAHPTLCWLPTKLAEWIGENLQEELGFPDKADKRAEPGTGWTAAELNGILHNHVVNGILTSFGCVEWESDLFRGVMRARCYPFDMPKRRFH